MNDTISPRDRAVLRQLAGQVAELAARPVEQEKRDLWYRHNALQPTRPLVFCDPEHGWHEIITPDDLACEGELARGWEFRLRQEIFWGAQMRDDRVIEPFFDVPHVHTNSGWGVHGEKVGLLPEPIAAMCRTQITIQDLLVEAYRDRSKHALLQALVLDPVVDSVERAERMMNLLLEVEADYLPQLA